MIAGGRLDDGGGPPEDDGQCALLGNGGFGRFLLAFLESRGFLNASTDEDAHCEQQDPHQEGNSPAPGREGLSGEHRGQHSERHRCESLCKRGTGGEDASIQSPPFSGRVLDDENLNSGGLPSQGEAFEEAQFDQQNGAKIPIVA